MKKSPPDIVILAAGRSKRMKSARSKLLHPVCGEPVIRLVVETALRLKPARLTVVVGHQAEELKKAVSDLNVSFVLQKERLGTGHAVMQLRGKPIGRGEGDLLVLNGDVPLLTLETLCKLIRLHRRTRASATVLSARYPDPGSYGRVIRGDKNELLRIVEAKDASSEEIANHEINTGTYVFNKKDLFRSLKGTDRKNAQQEYYLPDVIEILAGSGRRVSAALAEDYRETLGINSRLDLALATKSLRNRILHQWLEKGVTLIDPITTWIGPRVRIGQDSIIHPFVTLEGETRVGRECTIRSYSRVTDTTLRDAVTVYDCSILEDAVVAHGASIGPFARLRPGTQIGSGARVGNFVEIKKSRIGPDSKMSHLSYIGDTIMGRDVNIGAGTITCNYDGKHKHVTTIEDGVFVGSDSQFVAPVKIGKRSYVAAGSTITKDVPADSLAFGRARQTVKEGWVKKAKSGKNRKTSKRSKG